MFRNAKKEGGPEPHAVKQINAKDLFLGNMGGDTFLRGSRRRGEGGWLTGPSLSSTIADPPMASQLTMQTKHLKKGLLSTAGSLKKRDSNLGGFFFENWIFTLEQN